MITIIPGHETLALEIRQEGAFAFVAQYSTYYEVGLA
jgi:hypothetical protein